MSTWTLHNVVLVLANIYIRNIKAIKTRVGECRRNLRLALDIYHRAVFFIASAHFQIKSNEEMTQPESDDFKRLEKLEMEGYEQAKDIRKEILQEVRET